MNKASEKVVRLLLNPDVVPRSQCDKFLSRVRFIRFGDDTRRRTVKPDSHGAHSDALQVA
jgi:hypothetical protein